MMRHESQYDAEIRVVVRLLLKKNGPEPTRVISSGRQGSLGVPWS